MRLGGGLSVKALLRSAGPAPHFQPLRHAHPGGNRRLILIRAPHGAILLNLGRIEPMSSLKLVAFDAEDLAVVSAHLEEATLTRADMVFLPRERRFVLVARRKDREDATAPHHMTGLHFERVTRVRTLALPDENDKPLTLIGLAFAKTDDPAGEISLLFADGMAIRLDVECLEAQMADLAEMEAR